MNVNVVLAVCSEYGFSCCIDDLSFTLLEMDFVISITQLTDRDQVVLQSFHVRNICEFYRFAFDGAEALGLAFAVVTIGNCWTISLYEVTKK